MSPSARILVVAHRTAATPKLLEQVRARAKQGPCSFVLLVPRLYRDPETEDAAKVIEPALPLLEDAAGARTEAIAGDAGPVYRAAGDARERALRRGDRLDAASPGLALAEVRPTRPG